VNSVAFSPDSSRIITGSDNGSAHIWDTKAGKAIWVLKGAGEKSAAFSPDGTRVVTASYRGVSIWDAINMENPEANLPGHSAAFSPDGKCIVIGSVGCLWCVATREAVILRGVQGVVSPVSP
jgi:WD40 repeat protein